MPAVGAGGAGVPRATVLSEIHAHCLGRRSPETPRGSPVVLSGGIKSNLSKRAQKKGVDNPLSLFTQSSGTDRMHLSRQKSPKWLFWAGWEPGRGSGGLANALGLDLCSVASVCTHGNSRPAPENTCILLHAKYTFN